MSTTIAAREHKLLKPYLLSAFVALALPAFATIGSNLKPWQLVWVNVLLLLLVLKALTLYCCRERLQAASSGRLLGYMLLWPGLRPLPFIESHTPPSAETNLWRAGCINLVTGACLLWGVRYWPGEFLPQDIRVCISLAGVSLLVHFGLFDLMAAAWCTAGVPVEKLFCNPVASVSLAEFWGRRWNRAFSGCARDLIFIPAARRLGASAASMLVFLFSGVVHELVITFPARGGYGRPTAYFLIQGLCTQLEHFRPVQKLVRRSKVGGWMWTAMIVLLPVPLLFPGHFLEVAAVPFLEAIGAGGSKTN